MSSPTEPTASNIAVVGNDWFEQSFATRGDIIDPGHQVREQIDLLCTEDPDSAACVPALEPVPAPSVVAVAAPGPSIPVPVRSSSSVVNPSRMGPQPSAAASKENVAPVVRRRTGVRVTDQAGKEVNLADFAPGAAAKKPSTAAAAPALPVGPRCVETPDDALACLETYLKGAGIASCGAFLQHELMAHQGQWVTDKNAGSSVAAAWPLVGTVKRFIAALHDKFPPKGDAECHELVRAWVRDVTVAVDAVQLAAAQRKRADGLLKKTLEEIKGKKN
ncbi:hypothetical protein HD806DRAFT_528672 [Xylariaceae sp. AK1471]|nr:hypothetical protein HD806DRAFT_528672 [Xylariaceae sp. AK1471]